ncbi:OmpA family protein [Ralstonia insidiosa]|uniref:OmpA family protein n=1 Tax=Ralstonia insidiosa TaxID=190721 RepID=A0A848NZ67_9RALS|nr:OmpA family protein [Ralstonia insidiosa]NMV38233.1 OmpA family protein [Ralstonia insidiosa]
MKTSAIWVLTLAVPLAACSSASGPTFNAYQVNPQDGVPTYRVECHGLLQGQSVCTDKAREMCGDQPVRPLEPVTPFGRSTDVRTLTFQCGPAPAKPVAATEPAPAPVPVATPVVVKRLDLGGDANFDTDQATLTPVAKRKLDQLVADSRGITFKHGEISGFTDSRASAAHNLALSQRRADSVAAYLRGQGLQCDDLIVRGFGKDSPVASNATAAGRAMNRRVEIRLIQP